MGVKRVSAILVEAVAATRCCDLAVIAADQFGDAVETAEE